MEAINDPSMPLFERYSPAGLTGFNSILFFWACHTIFWTPFCKTISNVVRKYVKKQPYAKQYDELNQKNLKNSYGVDWTLEGSGSFGCELIAICGLQHQLGALLCVPAVFPSVANFLGISTPVAVFIAKQGALCEAGWELGDIAHRIYEKFLLGRHDLQPTGLFIIMSIHHFLGITMTLPLNVYYGSLPPFLEGVFLLQLAAGVGLATQQYGFMLDTTKSTELFQMKFCCTLTFVCMWYTRAIRYCMLYHEFSLFFWDNNTMWMAATVAALVMGLLNLLFVADATKKFLKYITLTTKQAAQLKKDASK